MRTFVELISRALDESFEKPEPAAGERTPAYRPGMIPVKANTRNTHMLNARIKKQIL